MSINVRSSFLLFLHCLTDQPHAHSPTLFHDNELMRSMKLYVNSHTPTHIWYYTFIRHIERTAMHRNATVQIAESIISLRSLDVTTTAVASPAAASCTDIEEERKKELNLLPRTKAVTSTKNAEIKKERKN